MFRNRIINFLKNVRRSVPNKKTVHTARPAVPISMCLTGVFCEKSHLKVAYDEETLGHDFLIRQATTVNVNAATQLLTVTLVAIQDTSERLRDHLSQEICLVRQAMEWGEGGTPPHHWDQLVAVRGALADLRHNLRSLLSYMEYAEKLATVAAEISFLSGNAAASDAICERIDHACRTCKAEKLQTTELEQESLALQQQAIVNVPQLENLIKEKPQPPDVTNR